MILEDQILRVLCIIGLINLSQIALKHVGVSALVSPLSQALDFSRRDLWCVVTNLLGLSL